jgi:lipoprotein-releasing system permease protein
MLGVGVFIAIGGMMDGFHQYFLRQLVETNPHIVITDEFRQPAPQPLRMLRPDSAVEIRRILPRDPVRGVSGAAAILEALNRIDGISAAPTLRGQIILRSAGRDYAVSGIGVDPPRELRVTNIVRDMVKGSFEALASEPNGVVIGTALADKMGVALGDAVLAATSAGMQTNLKIVGMFQTGIDAQDMEWAILPLARQQSIQARPRVVNEIHIRLADIKRSIPIAQSIEQRWGFKSAPWEETYKRILDVFALQDSIMFLTTTSILVVAGFGIFNIISTIVMEKARDIAIMRSIGMPARDVVTIFMIEGLAVGVVGTIAGWAAGWGLAALIRLVPAPTSHAGDTLPVALSMFLFAVASVIAISASVGAAWLPSRRAARTDPLAVIRGAT